MKLEAVAYAGLLLQAPWVHAVEDEPSQDALSSFDFGETVQYTLNNIVALDDAWSPDHLPDDKSYLDYLFYGQSPPVYPSRKCAPNSNPLFTSQLVPRVSDCS